jgi:glycopeptide antibiotics resistance protein
MNYYAFTTFETLSHVLELWLIFVPLGFVTARVSKDPRQARMWAVILAFIIAAPTEYGQGWIVDRFPDITDIAMSTFGGYLGAWLATRGETLFDELMTSLKAS